MILGVTGPRTGASLAQLKRLYDALLESTALHHGACTGVDAAAHRAALTLGLVIVVHPPEDLKYADLSTMIELPSVTVLPRKPYLERDHDMVDECDALLALPDKREILRSGTWATVRYARKTKTQRLIYGLDGAPWCDCDCGDCGMGHHCGGRWCSEGGS